MKGIENILVIDDVSSVSYSKSNIDNTYTIKPDLNGLIKIFEETPDLIFSYDTRDSISLIMADNTEISLHAYNPIYKPVFLKITNKELKDTDNEILISLRNNSFIKTNLIWSINDENVVFPKIADLFDGKSAYGDNSDIAKNLIDGYECQRPFLNNYKFPAFSHCMNQRIKTKRQLYQGYMPAIGQLMVICQNLKLINYVLTKINHKPFNFKKKHILSSSEFRYNIILTWKETYLHHTLKTNANTVVLPLFKKI